MSVAAPGHQQHRLDRGGRIDRRRPLGFTYDGTRYEGYAGDTLASALLANGVHLVGRSFKYERPRHGGRIVRRPSRGEPELLAVGPVRSVGAQQRPWPPVPGGLLLQDVHV